MLQNNNHNSSCNFAEQIVSFLYGEISETEKSNLELHLQSCSVCADEIAGFVSVRSSIQQWRAEDFEVLSTPAFEVMPAKNGALVSDGWFKSFRSFWSFYPDWIPAAAAATVAPILIVVGLLWFAVSSPKDTELAANTVETGKFPVSSSPARQNPNNDSNIVEAESNDLATEKSVSSPVPVINKTVKDKISPLKTSEQIVNYRPQPIKVKRAVPAISDKTNERAAPKTFNKNKIPSLAIEEDEEKSLRLSDILEEISLK